MGVQGIFRPDLNVLCLIFYVFGRRVFDFLDLGVGELLMAFLQLSHQTVRPGARKAPTVLCSMCIPASGSTCMHIL